MQLGIEIFTLRSLPLREGDYFSIELEVNGESIPAASGRDEYKLNTIILPQKRLAGSGHKSTYATQDLVCGMGQLQARPSDYVNLPEVRDSFSLRLETNRLLDYRELSLLLELELRWLDHGQEQYHRVSLHHPNLEIDWLERGTYWFDLTVIYKDLLTGIA